MREKYGSSEDRGNRGAIARFMYRAGWIFFRAMFKTFWRLRIIGLQNLPKNTGVIIAANHTSYSDPPLIGACITSPIFY
ncbi:MAG: 1-acyl-sn-glycerol-3-phosphate acyltransferase, partial [Elusimicrobia bacterium]|nr:1-acyl-sn-glycerol-3-phosphate acyltransferase [Elusimicrobiota bacterium]